ncbi:MAG: hypothetical protein HYS09_04155 [Chloroflexi bacterium]|nr:hypothetical protein [Chloroflexota bacterium]
MQRFFLALSLGLFAAFLSAPGASALRPPVYLALGDSLAFGIGATIPAEGGYVALVHDKLRRSDRYIDRGLDLVNLAVPGATSGDLLVEGGQLTA